MDKIVSLIVCMWVWNVFTVPNSCSTDLGCPLLRGSSDRRLRRCAATLPLFSERTPLSLISSSTREEVAAVMDWTIGEFVWVRLRNERFHPGRGPVYTSWLVRWIEGVVVSCSMRCFSTVKCTDVHGWCWDGRWVRWLWWLGAVIVVIILCLSYHGHCIQAVEWIGRHVQVI